MFINCGIHAREWITISSCVYVAREVCRFKYIVVLTTAGVVSVEASEASATHAGVGVLGLHPLPSQVFRFALASSSLAILSARSTIE